MPEFETIIGRYFTMQVAGKSCRIYVEEAGEGIPLVCLHTAGSDARQYRHLLCDKAITDNYRVIAFDMPCTANRIRRPAFAKRNISSQRTSIKRR